MNTLELLKSKKYNDTRIEIYIVDVLLNSFISENTIEGEIYYYLFKKHNDKYIKALAIVYNKDGSSYVKGTYTLKINDIIKFRYKTIVPQIVLDIKNKFIEEL